jgi:hypothetical protein
MSTIQGESGLPRAHDPSHRIGSVDMSTIRGAEWTTCSWFAVDEGPGQPSRWATVRALRVQFWWDGQLQSG